MRKKTLLNITHDRKRIKISARVCIVSYVYFKDMFIPKYRLLNIELAEAQTGKVFDNFFGGGDKYIIEYFESKFYFRFY